MRLTLRTIAALSFILSYSLCFAQYNFEQSEIEFDDYNIKSVKATTHYDNDYAAIVETNDNLIKILILSFSGELISEIEFDSGLNNDKINHCSILGNNLYTTIENNIIRIDLNSSELTTHLLPMNNSSYRVQKWNQSILLRTHERIVNTNTLLYKIQILDHTSYQILNTFEKELQGSEVERETISPNFEGGMHLNITTVFDDMNSEIYTFTLTEDLELDFQFEGYYTFFVAPMSQIQLRSYYNSLYFYQDVYTFSDAEFSTLSLPICNGIDTSLPLQGKIVARQWYKNLNFAELDPGYYVINDGSTKIFDCYHNLVQEFNSDLRNQFHRYDDESLYAISHSDKIKISRLSRNSPSIENLVFSSQQQIDQFNNAYSVVKADVIIDDALDGIIDIVSIDSLMTIEKIEGSLKIRNNNALEDLEALSISLQVSDSIIISNNAVLNYCSNKFICNHLITGKDFDVNSNGVNCASSEIILRNCELCPSGDVEIDNCFAEWDYAYNFPYCETISGDLSFSGSYFDYYDNLVIDFNTFSRIKKVEGKLEISGDLITFSDINTEDRKKIKLNIDTVKGELFMSNLINIDTVHLKELNYVGKLYFSSPLANLNVPKLNIVSESVHIDLYYNSSLNFNYDWAHSIDTLKGGLTIENDHDLYSLEVFESLKYIGSNLALKNNQNLETCSIEAVCNFILDSNEANINIGSNKNKCENIDSVVTHCVYDDFDNDGFNAYYDCNEMDPMINPDADEIFNNDVDENCDGTVEVDLDLDGFGELTDCNDSNFDINPDADEIFNNDVDENCDDTVEVDLDLDGFGELTDCNDSNFDINPDADEIPYNGIDDDCNPESLDDDLDQDGYVLVDDCNDEDASINPDAEEIVNNGIDEDCDGEDLLSNTYDLGSNSLSIFPNPVRNTLYVKLDKADNLNLRLHNSIGQLLVLKNTKIALTEFDISEFERGIYILEVYDIKTQQRVIEKILVQ